MHPGVIRIEPKQLLEFEHRSVVVALEMPHVGLSNTHLNWEWIECAGLVDFMLRFLESPERLQERMIAIVRYGQVWIQFDGTPEFTFCAGKIRRQPRDEPLGVVCFRKHAVERQRTFGRRLGLGICFRGRKTPNVPEDGQRIRQACVSGRVIGVLIDGLLKILPCLLKARIRGSIDLVSTQQIQPVGFGIRGTMPRLPSFAALPEPVPESVRDRGDKPLLQVREVTGSFGITCPP